MSISRNCESSRLWSDFVESHQLPLNVIHLRCVDILPTEEIKAIVVSWSEHEARKVVEAFENQTKHSVPNLPPTLLQFVRDHLALISSKT